MNKKILIITVIALFILLLIVIVPKKKVKHKYKTGTPVTVELPYTFKTEKAEHLSILAFNSKKEKKYYEAIKLYREAIKVEPNNPRLFYDLSECYTYTDRPKDAILILDTAIILDTSCAAFYSNRGLIYWHLHNDQNALNDYNKAIQLDSTNWVFYSNLSRLYYFQNKLINACINFQLAKKYGLNKYDYSNDEQLKKIQKVCKQ